MKAFNFKDFTRLTCEDDCALAVKNVLDGEYEVSFYCSPETPVTILDIGANVGAFAIWALCKWNPETIYCFEPMERNYKQLMINILHLPPVRTKFVLTNKAVEAPSNKLYLDKTSTASASFYPDLFCNEITDQYVEIESMFAKDLPDCTIMKVDTEGCELQILTKYLGTHENPPAVIMFEFHREDDRRKLDNLMYNYNYHLSSGEIKSSVLGTSKYFHERVPIIWN